MLICDTHCDALWQRAYHDPAESIVTMENLKKGGVSLQVLAIFSGTDRYADQTYTVAMNEYREFLKLRDEGWEQALSPLEAEDGKVRVMLSIEGGEVMGGSVEHLHEFYGYGVRMIGLTWNRENEIGCPAADGGRQGIKPQGWEILREMERLKLPADTSHLNEAGFWDLIDRHGQPPMASHSCAKHLCGHFRNLTDEQIRAMASRGGWIGVNFCPEFLSEDGKATVATLCDHIDHMYQLGAEGHVGLGSDYDGIDTTPLGLETPAGLPLIFEELRRRGYPQQAIEGIAGKDFIAYYKRLGW